MRRTWPGLGLLLCTTLALGVGAAACRGDDDSGDDDAGPRPDGSGNDNTIYAIQMGMIPPGSSVRLEGVVVTAIDTFGGRVGGVHVQEPMGGPYSGVLVYNAMVPAGP